MPSNWMDIPSTPDEASGGRSIRYRAGGNGGNL